MMSNLFERHSLLYEDIINTFKKMNEISIQPNLDAFMFIEPLELSIIQLILESYAVHQYIKSTPFSVV